MRLSSCAGGHAKRADAATGLRTKLRAQACEPSTCKSGKGRHDNCTWRAKRARQESASTCGAGPKAAVHAGTLGPSRHASAGLEPAGIKAKRSTSGARKAFIARGCGPGACGQKGQIQHERCKGAAASCHGVRPHQPATRAGLVSSKGAETSALTIQPAACRAGSCT